MRSVHVVTAALLLASLVCSASVKLQGEDSYRVRRGVTALRWAEWKWAQRFEGQVQQQGDDGLFGGQKQGEGFGEGGEGGEGEELSDEDSTATGGANNEESGDEGLTGDSPSDEATGSGTDGLGGEDSTENGGDDIVKDTGKGNTSADAQGNGEATTGEEGTSTGEENTTESGKDNGDDKDASSGVDGEKGTPTTNGTVPEAPTAGNETAAFLAFSLLQMEMVNEEDAEFRTVPIFKNGSFTGGFEECPTTSDLEMAGTTFDDSKWYADGAYADRISFQYTFMPDSKDYVDFLPVIKSDSASGIDPSLMDSDHDMEGGMGRFTLLYRCEPDGQERNHLSLHLQITETHSLDTMWVKICGRGRFEHMVFGFLSGDNEDVTPFNADGTYGTEEQHTLEVGPTQLSTVLSAELEEPAWELDFADPYIKSDSDLVSVSLRETVRGGRLSMDMPKKFSILYSCEQNSARANIMFTFAIPPWDNVTASWRKVCGGTHSQGLLIGTSGVDSYEVMQDGELNQRFNVTENTSLEKAYESIEDIDASTNSKRFYITNSDESSKLLIQTIAMTMSNPEVLRTVVDVPFSIGSYLSSSGGTIESGETKSLKLRFICLRLGESLVMVTLPVQKFRNVEFGFIKHCSAPQVYQENGFLSTAGSLLGAIMALSVCGGIGLWVHLRRRSSRKYMAVPTSERVP